MFIFNGLIERAFITVLFRAGLFYLKNVRKKFKFLEKLKIYDYMGLFECSPTSDGAAAVIICSEKYIEQNPHLKPQAVEIVGIELGTGFL